MTQTCSVAVVGGGSFGTTIASLAADNGHSVLLWLRSEEAASEINQAHTNSRYLPGVVLNPAVRATTDLAALRQAELVFMAVPSQYCRETARRLAPVLNAGTAVVSTTKGIEADSFKLMSQVLAEELPQARVGALSGPNLAREIAARQLTGTVVASHDPDVCRLAGQVLRSRYLRVYASDDIYGAELGGALKNIYAIIAGMAAALGVGDNTKALLITRSLAEMSRFAVRLGANAMTFMGLSGMGDLIATCQSPLSRNYRVGFEVGQGKTLAQVVESLGQVAEGVNTLQLVKQRADELGVYMPLVQGLHAVLINGHAVDEVVQSMMSRERSSDVEFTLG